MIPTDIRPVREDPRDPEAGRTWPTRKIFDRNCPQYSTLSMFALDASVVRVKVSPRRRMAEHDRTRVRRNWSYAARQRPVELNGTIVFNASDRHLFINGAQVPPDESQQVYNHSPDGFNTGYGGSGPTQLALALMLRFATEAEAVWMYQRFKWACIAQLQGDWALDAWRVQAWINEDLAANPMPAGR